MDALAQALVRIRDGRVAEGCAEVAALIGQAVAAGHRAWAEAALHRALNLAPRNPVLLARMAALQHLAGHAAVAEQFAHQANLADPGEPVAATLMIEALLERGAFAQAAAIGEACLARTPRTPQVQRALSQVYLFMGRAHDGFVVARRAADQLKDDAGTLSTVCYSALYDETRSPTDLAALHHVFASHVAPDPAVAPLALRGSLPGRRLRLGLVTADLRQHPVGFLMDAPLHHLDRSRFDVYVYARNAHADAMSHRLQSLPLHWRDTTRADDASVHAAIQKDQIDVLLDLSGHTHSGRPRLFAGRAAPVQAGYLGYPFSSGLKGVDYLIGDEQLFPAGSEPLYRESLVRLPSCFLCLQPAADAPPVAPSPMLIRGSVTFGSFNHLAKLSEHTLALWADLLHQLPESRLMLCAVGLADAGTRAFTQQRFANLGIDARRVALLPPKPVLKEFLHYYDSVDIALDPLPFNGGTTTLQALWQGVPTITLPGRTLQNRMGASIMHHAGLDAFIARDATDYLRIAREWSERVAELARMRDGLRERLRTTSLYDGAQFTRGLEHALRSMATTAARRALA